jgi:hypothetical protein
VSVIGVLATMAYLGTLIAVAVFGALFAIKRTLPQRHTS